jgi:uncharacterized membrane protein
MLAEKLTRGFYSLLLAGLALCATCSNSSAQGFTLYTPYTKISVPPGESIDYPIDVINKAGSIRTADISVLGLPKDWTFQLKSGGWSIDQISVLPGEKKSFTLTVQVPLQINKGTYRFIVSARGLYELPLEVVVSQQGTFKTEFTVAQDNLVGAAKTTFTFNAKLRNFTAAGQVYALDAQAPPGWNVAFKASYKQVSSVNIDAGHTQDLTIDVTAPEQVQAGTYKIPVVASTGETSADLALTVGITGSYNVELTTPTGLLSTAVTAGNDKQVELVVKNTGSAPLRNITLQSGNPVNWNVDFDPKTVAELLPGATAQVFATVKPDDKAIAGDYITNIIARTAEASSTAPLRVSVQTSLLWSWSGILIILIALGGVYFLFRKYGRR